MPSDALGPLPDDIGKPGGLLNDEEIRRALSKNYLLRPGTFDFQQIKQSSYELRVGNAYEILGYKDASIVHFKKSLDDNESIPIAPGATVKILVKEQLWIPPNVLAHVYVLGQFFACGLAAEHTFADPGFCHSDFYITMNNVSSRTLTIKSGTPIAKMQFNRLGASVENLHPGAPRPIEKFVQYEKPKTLAEIRGWPSDVLLKTIASHGTPNLEIAQAIGIVTRTAARLKLFLYTVSGISAVILIYNLGLMLIPLLPPTIRDFLDKHLMELLVTFLVGGGGSTLWISKTIQNELKSTWAQAFKRDYYDLEK